MCVCVCVCVCVCSSYRVYRLLKCVESIVKKYRYLKVLIVSNMAIKISHFV